MLLGREAWAGSPFSFYRMEVADGGGGGGASDLPADDTDIDKRTDLDDSGKTALKAERTARRDAVRAAKAAETAANDLQTRLKTLEDAETERQAQAAKDAEAATANAGKFEELANTRAAERDKAVADLAEMVKERDALKTAVQSVVKTDFDTLPQEVRDFYPGAADDPVAMLAFIPKAKELAKKLPGGDQNNSQELNGAKPNPPVGDVNAKPDPKADETARNQNALRYAG